MVSVMNERIELQRQKEFYNSRWENFEYANRLKLLRCAAILNEIGNLGINKPRILDLGCGAGWLSNTLSMFGPTTGVDISDSAIKRASLDYPRVNFICDNFLSWDYEGEPFDIIVGHETLEHFEDQHLYLEAVYKLLASGGYLVLTTPNASTFYAMPDKERLGWSNQPIENWLTISKIKRLLAKKYKIVSLRTIIAGYGRKNIYKIVNSRHLKKILLVLGFYRFYSSLVLRLGFGLHIIVVAKKVVTT